ncbi:MAG: hypothetical protein K8R87_00580 [Verrucomicrobia bacterium]|nr:hypothetical protein [Verrucomicrobiota bacterium]
MDLVAIPFLIILLILIGIGIAVGLVFCVVAAFLLAAGVVSASAMVGVLRGSVLAGFRAFIWQAGALAGMIAGIAVVAGVRFFLETWREGAGPWIGGALGGMAGGLLIALLVDFLLRRLAIWLEKTRRQA